MAFQPIVRPNESKTKRFFKSWLFKIILALIILAGLLFLWYKYVGILVVTVNEKGSKIEVGDKKYENVKNKKIIFLRPDVYIFNINKDGFLEFQDPVDVRPFRINKEKVVLSKMFYVGGLSSADDFDISFLTKRNDNNFVYFSSSENSFYKAPSDSENYVIGNYNGQKIEIDLGLKEGDQVSNVRYSPSGQQALLTINSAGSTSIKWLDFSHNQIRKLDASITDVAWLSDSEVVGISAQTKLVKMLLNGSNLKVLTDLPAGSFQIFASQGFVFVESSLEGQDSSVLINLTSLDKIQVQFSGGLITGAKSSPKEDKFIVLGSKDQKTKVVVLNSDGSQEELPIDPYLDNIFWASDGQSLIYVSFDNSKKIYNFEKYNFADKKSTIFNTVSQDAGDPSNLIVNADSVNFILGQDIMGTKIK